jgi:hypothetical protein
LHNEVGMLPRSNVRRFFAVFAVLTLAGCFDVGDFFKNADDYRCPNSTAQRGRLYVGWLPDQCASFESGLPLRAQATLMISGVDPTPDFSSVSDEWTVTSTNPSVATTAPILSAVNTLEVDPHARGATDLVFSYGGQEVDRVTVTVEY